MPNLPKAVVIVAPHTSIWDFFVGLATIFALRLKVVFLAKDTLFRGPLGWVMRWLGGVPIDRSHHHNIVARAVDQFQEQDELILGIFPEGTRGKVERWRTGFYYVALGAGVPVVPVSLDFDRRIVGFGEPLEVTGDRTAEFAKLAAHFEGVKGRNAN
jgi:1-acyl-sn-glycerol-3-phosphate acyltransferase